MEIEVMKPFGEHSHTLMDVDDIPEIWDFLDGSFLPTVVSHTDQVTIFFLSIFFFF
jgi:hypothetical protein